MACSLCHVLYHRDCWASARRCAIYGCPGGADWTDRCARVFELGIEPDRRWLWPALTPLVQVASGFTGEPRLVLLATLAAVVAWLVVGVEPLVVAVERLRTRRLPTIRIEGRLAGVRRRAGGGLEYRLGDGGSVTFEGTDADGGRVRGGDYYRGRARRARDGALRIKSITFWRPAAIEAAPIAMR